MASLKDLRNRIASVKATQKITKAMQMVAAAKLRRAELAAAAARPYAERMERVLANLASSMRDAPGAPQLLAGTGEDRRHLLVVMTADRGLAGGFNASIARLARDEARRLIAEGKEVRFLCVGRKGADILRRQFPGKIDDVISLREVKTLGYSTANEIGERIIREYQDGGFDVATLFFSKFRSVVSQIPTAQQVIPAQIPEATGEDQLNGAIYEYEPSEEEILEVLLPKNVSIQIFKGLLENAASEQGARMSAMDNATRNAGEMIKKLSLQYNRTRQAQITKELIEIISGAEAL
ncbi:F0F1 ATP synthase subunit gamma [Hansschlegelia beijingensis]|uniref:ATP synthase gamma chain n=1 Tax=Hansschlegelia beijingensis TaxID=1133344 RepID=A0A7W6GER4_9HYPH|nr:F0F1 ATP synthase subunit gamma [Hansschlegelia beijingensis]MBB3973156.1 F-type H+-transporting ATPase subunit gamma [Hansschlegelia beijingensis]